MMPETQEPGDLPSHHYNHKVSIPHLEKLIQLDARVSSESLVPPPRLTKEVLRTLALGVLQLQSPEGFKGPLPANQSSDDA